MINCADAHANLGFQDHSFQKAQFLLVHLNFEFTEFIDLLLTRQLITRSSIIYGFSK